MTTERKLLKNAARMYALEGYEGLSMRKLAKDCGIAPSVIYHYYADKDALLERMFEVSSRDLGKKRATLDETTTAAEMMRQRIEFQIDHMETVVAVLKYYLHYRDRFEKQDSGYVPDTAYLHIKEVLLRGVDLGEFIAMDIDAEAKVITHAINGFLLEYYPTYPKGKEKQQLIHSIHRFIMRSILQL